MFKLQNHGNLFLQKEGSLVDVDDDDDHSNDDHHSDNDNDDDVDEKDDVAHDYDNDLGDDDEDDSDIYNFCLFFFFFFRLKLDLDFWSHPSHVGASVDIRVSMEAYPALAKLLKENGIVFTILIPDVQTLMDSENPPLARSERAGFSYNRYNRLQPVKE